MATSLKSIPALSFKQSPVQSSQVSGTAGTGHTAQYRNARWDDLKGVYQVVTLPELFDSGLSIARDKPCLGYRPVLSSQPSVTFANEYTWETYATVDTRRKALGSAIERLYRSGRFPINPDFEGVGVWAVNRPEWQIVDLACHAYNKVTVALYDTLGPNSVEYVINHSELPIIFCSSNHIAALLENAGNCPSLKMIISFDPLDASKKAEIEEKAKDKGVEVKEMSELEADGRTTPLEPIKPTLDQLAFISYTSGTTSDPKGVMITHGQMSAGVISHLHGLPDLPDNVVMFSYLPLAHIYGRLLELICFCVGGCVGYFTGNPANLLADLQCLKPHFFPSVPRVLNRIYASMIAHTRAPGLKGFLFRRAIATKLANFHATGVQTHALWDALVFKKVQQVVGGRLKFLTSASAPINREIMDFLKIAFGCEVMEGYALTETSASCTRTLSDDVKASGTVGGASMMNEIKLVDVPELSYFSTDKPNARGELCVRGRTIFGRYYKDEKKTQEAIDSEGWFHTGDVAEVDEVGRFKIIDRVKNIMKLSQGEYVALEKVENTYAVCPLIAQIYVHGESLKDHLVAIVVPDAPSLAETAATVGHKFDPLAAPAFAAACKDEKINKAVLDVLTAHAKKQGLKGFETVRAIHLTTDQFTVENNTLTPTFKIRRKDAYNLHKDAIQELYAQ